MFVIYDEWDDGYAMNSPLEGWIFTVLLSAATKFDTKEEAEKAIATHYNYHSGVRLVVRPYSDELTRLATKKGG